jgi:putative nucleotidyltransferase with HDIG domain
LLWGWIRSWRQERELANATRLLNLVHTGAAAREERDELSVAEREHLLRQLAGAVEGQDVYLNGHSRRVARHATMIARGMSLPSQEVARIRAAAAVHDVGKLRTPKAILNKPGRLTDAEFEVIKRHPVDGAEMVAALGDPELTRIVRHHHERLDGAGYPDRLHGEEIPLGARIIAVADTFDAITSARPYRDASPHQKAIDILRKEAGTQLDPDAVRAFLAYYSGNRPTAVWAILVSSLRRFVSWLTGDPAAAATISASKVAAATIATAAIGAAAAAAPVPVVHHAPARPAVAHIRAHVQGAAARTPKAASATGRQSVSAVVAVAAHRPGGRHTAKATATKTHGPAAHTRAGNRRRAQPRAVRHTSNGTAGAATGSPAPAHTPTPTSTSTTHAGASPTTSTSTSPTTSSAAPTTPQPATPTPPTTTPTPPTTTTPSQASNGNGNAYGHTKLLGNGHGNGLAKGHGNSTPTPVVSTPTIPTPTISTPTVPTPSPSTPTTAATTPVTTAPPPQIQIPIPVPSNGDDGHGHTHGHGHGSGNDG